MFSTVFHISVLLNLLIFFREAELQPTFSVEPSNPFAVVEGNSIFLEWSYDIGAGGGSIKSIEFVLKTNVTELLVEVENIGQKPSFLNKDYKDRLTVNSTATKISITILEADRTVDSGNYELTVERNPDRKRVTSSVQIAVQFPAKLTNVSDDQTVPESSNIQLFCEASGNPSPNIVWTRVLKDGSTTELQTGAPNTLDIPNINRNDSGTYHCKAVNGIGNPPNHTVKVNVTYPAKIVKVAASENEVAVQQSVSLQCRAEGNPPPSYEWTPCEPPQSVCDNSVLNISEVLNDGVYTCKATNNLGSGTGNVSVFIAGNVINVTLVITNKKCTDGKYNQSLLWTGLNETMNSLFANKSGYNGAQLKSVRCGSVIVDLQLKFNNTTREREVIDILRSAVKDGMLGPFQVNASSITGTRPALGKTTTATPTTPTISSDSDMTWIIVGVVVGIIVLGVAVAVIAWCMYKKRKCNRKDTKVHSNESQVQAKGNAQGEYAEVNPGYVITESNRNSTGVNPVTYDTVGNSTKKGKGAVVDETPTVSYAVVDKSKKKKREKKPKPGELQYAELAEFSRPQEMPKSSTSRGSYPTETQYADVNAM